MSFNTGRERRSFYEEKIFHDLNEAEYIRDLCAERLNKCHQAMRMAWISFITRVGLYLVNAVLGAILPILTPILGGPFVGMLGSMSMVFCLYLGNWVAIVIAIIAYYKTGSMLKVLGFLKNVAFWGWFIIPFFPIDLFVSAIVVTIAAVALVFVPMIPIYFFRRQAQMDYDNACEYIQRIRGIY